MPEAHNPLRCDVLLYIRYSEYHYFHAFSIHLAPFSQLFPRSQSCALSVQCIQQHEHKKRATIKCTHICMCLASEYVQTGALSGNNRRWGNSTISNSGKKFQKFKFPKILNSGKTFSNFKKKSIKFSKLLEIQIPETFPESHSLEKSQRV